MVDLALRGDLRGECELFLGELKERGRRRLWQDAGTGQGF